MPRRPRPGATIEVAPGLHWLRMPLPFALDHINLWLLDEGDAWTLVDTGYGDARDARAVGATLRDDDARPAAAPDRRDALPSRSPGQRRLARAALRLPRHDDAYGVPGRARDPRPKPRRTARATPASCSASHGMADADVAALAALGNRYANGVPTAPASVRRLLAGDRVDGRRPRVAGDRRLRPFAGARVAVRAAAQRADVGRHAAAQDHHQRERVAVRPGRRPARPLPRIRSPRSSTCRRTRWCCRRTGCRSAAFRCASKRCGRITPRAWPSCRRRSPRPATPVSAVQMVPILFRRPLDLHQRFFAMGEAIAHLNHLWHRGRLSRTLSPEGQVRFAI